MTGPTCGSQQRCWRDTQKPAENSTTNLERLWTVFEERSTRCSTFRRTDIHWKRCATVCGDSDHAGCLETRKNTTGTVLMRHAHCLKVSSHTQPTISLSVGESEYYGIVNCAATGSGARSMLADLGMLTSDDTPIRRVAVGSHNGWGRPRDVRQQQRVQVDVLRKSLVTRT